MARFLFASYFCSWTRFNVNVARSNGNPSWCVFQSYSVVLRFVADARSWRPFWWGWGILRCLQKNVICSRIVENNALLEKLRNPRKKGRRRSTYCFEGEFKGLLNAEFLANFRLSRSSVLITVSRGLSPNNEALDQMFPFSLAGLLIVIKSKETNKKS